MHTNPIFPDQEVVPVILHHLRQEAISFCRGRLPVPEPCEALVGFRDLAWIHVEVGAEEVICAHRPPSPLPTAGSIGLAFDITAENHFSRG